MRIYGCVQCQRIHIDLIEPNLFVDHLKDNKTWTEVDDSELEAFQARREPLAPHHGFGNSTNLFD